MSGSIDYTAKAKEYLGARRTVNGVPTLLWWNGVWWTWHGGKWSSVTSDSIKCDLVQWKPDLAPSTIRNLLERVGDLRYCRDGDMPCWVGPQKGKGPEVIAFRNGLLDVESWVNGIASLREPSPLWFSGACCPFDFDVDAICPTWMQCLRDWFEDDEDSIALLQEWMGYLLTQDVSAEKMMVLWGPPRSGKSATLAVIGSLLDQRQSAPATIRSLGGRFLADMLGKTHVHLGDARLPKGADREAAVETLIGIIGRDPQRIEGKGKEAVHVTLPVRFTLACNDFPNFGDHTGALRERILVVRYRKSFAGSPDTTLKDRLLLERAGIANWALSGLRRLRRQTPMSFTEGFDSLAAKDQWDEEMNPVITWIGEHLRLDGESVTEKEILWKSWCKYCERKNLMCGTYARFFKALLGAKSRELSVTRPRNKGDRSQCIKGCYVVESTTK